MLRASHAKRQRVHSVGQPKLTCCGFSVSGSRTDFFKWCSFLHRKSLLWYIHVSLTIGASTSQLVGGISVDVCSVDSPIAPHSDACMPSVCLPPRAAGGFAHLERARRLTAGTCTSNSDEHRSARPTPHLRHFALVAPEKKKRATQHDQQCAV